jgi:hypothetical protein
VYVCTSPTHSKVEKLSGYISRYAVAEAASHTDISKEKYYDLFNIGVHLLKAIETLDPDRLSKNDHQVHVQKRNSKLSCLLFNTTLLITLRHSTAVRCPLRNDHSPRELDKQQQLNRMERIRYFFQRRS